MASWTITTLFLVTIFSLCYNSLTAQSVEYSISESSNLFANELMQNIVEGKSSENIICSPASIYNNLVFTYFGAEGSTADELGSVLRAHQVNKIGFALKYADLLRPLFKKNEMVADAPQLNMVNRIYVSNKINVTTRFNLLAQKVDFSESLTAVGIINKWVEMQTENKIKNFLTPNSVNGNTNAILVNAIYFKAKWLTPFWAAFTSKRDFYVNPSQKVLVDTMYTQGIFGYGKMFDLNAQALEMRYKNSDISMLVILPNDIDGLRKLEENLKGKNLNEITSKMNDTPVRVLMPKFRLEYEMDLKETLKKMGISSMFEKTANLSGIFEGNLSQKISDVRHKAYIECNEDGTEAAAATYIEATSRMNIYNIFFHANHPFAFFIRNNNILLFAGHVAKF